MITPEIKIRKPKRLKYYGIGNLYNRYVNRWYKWKQQLPKNGDRIRITWLPNSDDWKGYRGLGKVITKVNQMVVPPKQAMDKLPWVHTVISNAKKMTTGVHHSVAKEYLQNYLNEFCWKINRRSFNSDPFERAMCMAVDEYWC